MPPTPIPAVDGVLLAAGLSRRMGQPKPLLMLDGEPLVRIVARKMSLVCRRVVVVTGDHAADVCAKVNDIALTVHNPDFHQGMFGSLQTGLRALPGARRMLYHFVDQPHLPPDFYTRFIDAASPDAPWIQPTFNGRKGHPLLLSEPLLTAIAGTPLTGSLREVLARSAIRPALWNCNYPQILDDFDTPEDWNTYRNSRGTAHE